MVNYEKDLDILSEFYERWKSTGMSRYGVEHNAFINFAVELAEKHRNNKLHEAEIAGNQEEAVEVCDVEEPKKKKQSLWRKQEA